MAGTSKAPRRLELIDTTTGEVVERKARVPHAFDGKGYTLEGHGTEVPNFSLNLSGTEWDVLDWMKQHGGSANPLRMDPAYIAPRLCSTENTVKAAITRLVRLNLVIRIGGQRSGTYQLNPRRFWEGSGESHLKACLRMDPPAITPDAKATTAALKAATKAVTAANAASAVADEAEQAMPGSNLAIASREAAEQATASAMLAVDIARGLAAKLPIQIRRFLEEVAK